MVSHKPWEIGSCLVLKSRLVLNRVVSHKPWEIQNLYCWLRATLNCDTLYPTLVLGYLHWSFFEYHTPLLRGWSYHTHKYKARAIKRHVHVRLYRKRDYQGKRANLPHWSYTKVILLKLFVDIVPSSFADITPALCGCFRGGSVYAVSFRFVSQSKENPPMLWGILWYFDYKWAREFWLSGAGYVKRYFFAFCNKRYLIPLITNIGTQGVQELFFN